MSITIKAYLKLGEDANAEIRRFVVDPDACSSFEFLTNKLMQVFPSLANENLGVAWKDSEGDLIAFSSDEELGEALGQLSEEVFRVYVHIKSRPSQGPGQGVEDVFHSTVVSCNGCVKEITGPYFKCVTCAGYALCMKCEKKGIHPEHDLMKIRKPKVGTSGHGVNMEQQIISSWPIVEDIAHQCSVHTTTTGTPAAGMQVEAGEFNTIIACQRSRDANTLLPGAIKGPGHFLSPEEVLQVMNTGEPSSQSVPYGLKEDVYFLLNNSFNFARRQANRKGTYVDDCGAWGHCSLKSHHYILNGQKLQYVDFKDGLYWKIIKTKRVPLDPQPEGDSIISFKRYYLSLKRSNTYKKRITTVSKCPENLNCLKLLAVVEYIGPYPCFNMCHGNAKKRIHGYIRAGSKVQENQ